MKEETKAKRERMKKKLLEIEKEAGKLGKGLSTAEKNKLILDLMTKKDDVEIEETPEEQTKKRKLIHQKEFKCSCGMYVTLIGEIDQERTKCSKCLELEIA